MPGGQTMPLPSWCCSMAAAAMRARPIEERGAHRLRVLGAQLEDVADLDDAGAFEVALALRARIASARLAQVAERRLRHHLEADARAVVVGLVGAGDVGAPA
jgi:hypothetical protein